MQYLKINNISSIKLMVFSRFVKNFFIFQIYAHSIQMRIQTFYHFKIETFINRQNLLLHKE